MGCHDIDDCEQASTALSEWMEEEPERLTVDGRSKEKESPAVGRRAWKIVPRYTKRAKQLNLHEISSQSGTGQEDICECVLHAPWNSVFNTTDPHLGPPCSQSMLTDRRFSAPAGAQAPIRTRKS